MRDWPPVLAPAFSIGVFLDRDGTLNEDTHYPYKLNDLGVLPGVFEALRNLAKFPVHVIAVTNQSGIALGRFTRQEMSEFNKALRMKVEAAGGRIDAFYFCPHLEPKDLPPGESPCSCAKPSPGMLIEAAADFRIDLRSSYMIGDKTSDIAAGRAAGCKTILVLSGKAGKEEGATDVRPDLTVTNLPHAIEKIANDLVEN